LTTPAAGEQALSLCCSYTEGVKNNSSNSSQEYQEDDADQCAADALGALCHPHNSPLSPEMPTLASDAQKLFLAPCCICRFYFHASEVRDWMRMMHARAQAEDDSEIDDQGGNPI